MSLEIPASGAIVDVSIVDTTLNVTNLPASALVGPELEGFPVLTPASHAFLVTNGDRQVIFDLGSPKNWREDLPPAVVEQNEEMEKGGTTAEIELYTSDILEEGGVDLDELEAIIWSHTHWDHIGKPSLFPTSVDLVMGPGILDAFGRGWPGDERSPYREEELEGRTVTEVDFAASNASRIGGLEAFDYFGDGSFWLLDAPGHAIGHLNALARVTSDPDTYIFMGADSYHHASQIRPSEKLPLPESIRLHEHPASYPDPLPAEAVHEIHPSNNDDSPPYAENLTDPDTTPYFAVSDDSIFHEDPELARDVVAKLQQFDADERIFVISAHDISLRNIIEYFPKCANDWASKGWKEQGQWQFLAEFEAALGFGEGADEKRSIGRRRGHAMNLW